MSLISDRDAPHSPLLRLTIHRERPQWGDDDFDPAIDDNGGLVMAAERVDGLLEIRDPRCCECNTPAPSAFAEWAESDWGAIGQNLIEGELPSEIDLEHVRLLVVTGRMWSRHYNGPDGEDWDSGFDLETVEKVVYDEPRYLVIEAGRDPRYAYEVAKAEVDAACSGKLVIVDVISKNVVNSMAGWRPVSGLKAWSPPPEAAEEPSGRSRSLQARSRL